MDTEELTEKVVEALRDIDEVSDVMRHEGEGVISLDAGGMTFIINVEIV